MGESLVEFLWDSYEYTNSMMGPLNLQKEIVEK